MVHLVYAKSCEVGNMRATGIVRTIDELGRIIIPKEIREINDIAVGSKMEIFIDGESIVLKPCVTADVAAGRIVTRRAFGLCPKL